MDWLARKVHKGCKACKGQLVHRVRKDLPE